MMDSLLLRAATRIILPLQLGLSLFLLLRGHNEPGGGFIGGLVAACGIILYGIAHGVPAGIRLLRLAPQTFIGLGLLIAAASGVLALLQGQPFMTGLWAKLAVPTVIIGKLKFGTPLLFDVGVYLVVTGVAVLMIFSIAEEEEE